VAKRHQCPFSINPISISSVTLRFYFPCTAFCQLIFVVISNAAILRLELLSFFLIYREMVLCEKIGLNSANHKTGNDFFSKPNNGMFFVILTEPRGGVSTEALKDSVLCLRRGMKACKERRPGGRLTLFIARVSGHGQCRYLVPPRGCDL